jgi:hypothetical protein
VTAVSDAVLFTLIFGGLFVLRVVFATIFFALILPSGDRCPNCDHPTLRVASPVIDRVFPWFRRSWCLRCGWEGMLRHGTLTPERSRVDTLTPR